MCIHGQHENMMPTYRRRHEGRISLRQNHPTCTTILLTSDFHGTSRTSKHHFYTFGIHRHGPCHDRASTLESFKGLVHGERGKIRLDRFVENIQGRGGCPLRRRSYRHKGRSLLRKKQGKNQAMNLHGLLCMHDEATYPMNQRFKLLPVALRIRRSGDSLMAIGSPRVSERVCDENHCSFCRERDEVRTRKFLKSDSYWEASSSHFP